MFKVVIFACLAVLAKAGFLHYAAAPAPIPILVPQPVISSSQYKAQDTLGQYNYGYATGNGIAQNEARGIGGEVAGGYSYTSPEGKQVSIAYTAGEGGFKASGDAIPKAQEPTAEVAEATKQHLAAKVEAEAKAAAAPEEIPEPIAIGGHFAYAAPGPIAHLAAPGPIAHLAAPGPIAIAAPYPYTITKTIEPAALPAKLIHYDAPHVKLLIAQPKIAPITGYSYSFSTGK